MVWGLFGEIVFPYIFIPELLRASFSPELGLLLFFSVIVCRWCILLVVVAVLLL